MTWDYYLRAFARQLRQRIVAPSHCFSDFNELALELFRLQFEHNVAYRKFCENRRISATDLSHWTEIPTVPTSAFKETELSCIPSSERTNVFHSSGTTQHRPSRHFHHSDSLAVYETSLTTWFAAHFEPSEENQRAIVLTPPPELAPNSSLVHMFDTLQKTGRLGRFIFSGTTLADGSWQLDCSQTIRLLREAEENRAPILLLGTAFTYVHLLDFLFEKQIALRLPPGSRAMETGGYKGRSRVLPKSELHKSITVRLGIPDSHIICEYGMSELSSQAYDRMVPGTAIERPCAPPQLETGAFRTFRFPPWARSQIISPETGQEVAEGETGLLRIMDLANVYSVMAVQTEDLAVRRGGGFEVIGRAALAEPRGCSLMAS